MPPTPTPCRFTWPTLRNLAAMLLDHFGEGKGGNMGDRDAGTHIYVYIYIHGTNCLTFHFKSRGRNRVDTGFFDL